MTDTAQHLELELRADLAELAPRFADDESAEELYRALATVVWRNTGGPEGHVSLSWARAERVVNALREQAGRGPLTLAQTGGEGDVSDRVARELARLGWRAQPLSTSRADDAHLSEPDSPPPAGHGERLAPAGDSGEWRRVGDREAAEATGRLLSE